MVSGGIRQYAQVMYIVWAGGGDASPIPPGSVLGQLAQVSACSRLMCDVEDKDRTRITSHTLSCMQDSLLESSVKTCALDHSSIHICSRNWSTICWPFISIMCNASIKEGYLPASQKFALYTCDQEAVVGSGCGIELPTESPISHLFPRSLRDWFPGRSMIILKRQDLMLSSAIGLQARPFDWKLHSQSRIGHPWRCRLWAGLLDRTTRPQCGLRHGRPWHSYPSYGTVVRHHWSCFELDSIFPQWKNSSRDIFRWKIVHHGN